MKILWTVIAIGVIAPMWVTLAEDAGRTPRQQQNLDRLINEIEANADPAGPPIEDAVSWFRELKVSSI